MTVAPVPPPGDRALGLGFYGSRSPGVAGRLKDSSDDFRVTEISTYPRPDPLGRYTVLRVVSRDWEQHELAGVLARRLGLPPRAIQWSGTKDRRAVAERLLSYVGDPPTGPIDLPRVEIVEAYRARDGLVLGHHYGNAFDLVVRNLALPIEEAVRAYDVVAEELRSGGGFPNFFGAQRFGEVRPITHEVGRWVVRGDLDRAVDEYLVGRPSGGTPGAGDAARVAYAGHRDPARALTEFPPEYRFERLLLQRLAHGESAARAFRAFAREFRLLFVHAFQSYLFNRWLTARAEAGLPIGEAAPGDHLLRIERDGTVRAREPVPVTSDNLDECRAIVQRGRAQVAGPLVGYETPRDEGPVGQLLDRLLIDEQVDRAMFRLPATPELASAGAWRTARMPLPPLSIAAEVPDGVRFRFSLTKGVYATVLVREFLKGATALSRGAG